ncbi:MAG: hypothetical protein IPJ16_02000 [Bacteroidales bacterium]|nr:hypothetical protein [Bacteroidales bacterium]
MYSTTHVEIYYNYVLLARHLKTTKQYGYTTDKEHLAETHKYHNRLEPDRFPNWAKSIDGSVRSSL